MAERRTFNDPEQMLIKLVAERLPEQARQQLLSDMEAALVDEDGDFVRVHLPNYGRPKYTGHQNLPFEGKLYDLNGEPVSVLLNTESGRLLELEFIWWGSESRAKLDWSTLQIADATRDAW